MESSPFHDSSSNGSPTGSSEFSHGAVQVSNFDAPMFRSHEQGQEPGQGPEQQNDSRPPENLLESENNPSELPQENSRAPSCNSCGKPKISNVQVRQQNLHHHSHHSAQINDSENSPSQSPWKIIIWIVVAVIGVIIVVAIFRCMTCGESENALGALSSPLGEIGSPYQSVAPPSVFKSSDLLGKSEVVNSVS